MSSRRRGHGAQTITWENKPLVFPEEKDQGFEMEADTPPGRHEGKAVESDATPMPGPGGDADELDATASLPTDSDILVCYPTFPGKGQPSAVTRGVPLLCH